MIQDIVTYSAYLIGPAVLLGYLAHRFYFAGPRCKSKKRLDGKVTIVTGANTGIGYETARDFARRGAHVIVACRDAKRGQAAVDKIILETNNNKVELEILDLASLQSVRDFADRIRKKFPKIDILVNNAGLVIKQRSETVDGYEMTFQVNHLGHFLLTNLLLDIIRDSPESRIVNVSAKAYHIASIRWDDINMKNNYGSLRAYAHSKLANILFTKYLVKKLEGTSIITNTLHPGGVRTEIWREIFKTISISSIFAVLTYPLLLVFMKDSEEGAQTTLHCALDDEKVPNQQGEFFCECKPVKLQKHATDMEAAERLWKLSAEMVGLKN